MTPKPPGMDRPEALDVIADVLASVEGCQWAKPKIRAALAALVAPGGVGLDADAIEIMRLQGELAEARSATPAMGGGADDDAFPWACWWSALATASEPANHPGKLESCQEPSPASCGCGKTMAACADTEDCSGQSMPAPSPPTADAGGERDNLKYRVGRKVGRTIYEDDSLIGVMDNVTDARRVVDALNLASRRPVERERLVTLIFDLFGYQPPGECMFLSTAIRRSIADRIASAVLAEIERAGL